MAITNGSNGSQKPAASKQPAAKCVMCEGAMEKANTGFICNTCKDKMMKR